ncbi:MAG TPA: sorbosone dehydrogenase, partial [Verrucomicrobiales bacterium]|nr:sorbosone dehydrogenase [Verrucomicrobiales bacterium]
MNLLCYFIAWALVGLILPVSAQRELKDIPPPAPGVEKASFKVADGFEVNLWAADPLLAKPSQIAFDRKGRLWVASSETYPQLNVNQEPSDRILILEDSDKDGQADKSSVYYDQLVIPGGVLPDGNGGAYVAHGEELLHLHDRNGDGKA